VDVLGNDVSRLCNLPGIVGAEGEGLRSGEVNCGIARLRNCAIAGIVRLDPNFAIPKFRNPKSDVV